MSAAQRIAVWNGERASTTGGLKKPYLMKNRHGRIVSKRKSEVARKLNNLGNFLARKAKGKAAKKAEPKPEAKQPKPKPKPKPEPPKVAPPKPKPKPKPTPPKVAPKKKSQDDIQRELIVQKYLERKKKKAAMKDTGYIKNITKDPDVIAERKKKGRHFKSAIDPANIIPNQRAGLPGKLKKAPKKKKKIEVIDLSGGRLRRITQKQLDQAKKKPVPRRPKKKRRKKRDSLSLTV